MGSSRQTAGPLSLFYSYSHRDEAFREDLEKHLAFLRRSGLIAEWHDRKIGAGDEWKAQIDHHLATADIVLLLVSADFIDSDYCWSEEMTKALARHERGEARVIPVILRPCRWGSTPLRKLQAVPKDARPVSEWPSRDAAFDDIAAALERTVHELRQQRLTAEEEGQHAEAQGTRKAQEECQRIEAQAKREAEAEQARQQAEIAELAAASALASPARAHDASSEVFEVLRDGAWRQASGVIAELPAGTVFRDAPGLPEMVVIPAGSFLMGSPPFLPLEWPQHEVRFARAFAVGRYEVSFEEWDACVAAGGCGYTPSDQGWGRGRRPVIYVSWEHAQAYVLWISSKTGKPYRLPSEAEWEYAARAGTTTNYPWGDEPGRNRANTDSRPWASVRAVFGFGTGTANVGSFEPNAFGLYDMIGNVWEWTQDCWHDSYECAPADGRPSETGDCGWRVVRGGSWNSGSVGARSASRSRYGPGHRVNDLGFRLARTL
jgi:formylglycine-generating enzyme required for sulfatase activity